ncbi:hypothetical protein [Streptomyces sp. NPDC050564]|uniref:hypothetical protein n=1 Tax=Streptomyces sp. NPDC050564 TaxID=3365631 RepID=UPI0037BB1D9A
MAPRTAHHAQTLQLQLAAAFWGTGGAGGGFTASLPDALVQRAVERGMTMMALTDRDTVAGTSAAPGPEPCAVGE